MTVCDYLLNLVQLCQEGRQDRCPPVAWFVGTYGVKFPVVRYRWDRRQVSIRRGPFKACFENATKGAWEDGRFVYVEGFAMGVIPCHHAWVYDRVTSVAYDPTWREGSDYVGVPFDTEYLNRTLLEKKTYGLIDWYERHWPILEQPSHEWQACGIDDLLTPYPNERPRLRSKT